MNGFERGQRGERMQSGSSDAAGRHYPDDFSPEDTRFAEELRGFFAPECDELPPLFAQTLLGNAADEPTPPGFEQRLSYRVMRRLRLPRRPLAARSRLMRHLLGEALRHPRAGVRLGVKALREETLTVTTRRVVRPIVGIMGTLAVLVIASVLLTAPSFAMGVQIILGQTGVREVNGYPSQAITTATSVTAKRVDADDRSLLPNFTPAWVGMTADNYTYQGMRLLTPAKKWSQGPIVDLQYTGNSDGSTLDMREFLVASQYAAVLQVVQDGSATPAQVDASTPAIYVDGAWMQRIAQTDMSSAHTSHDAYIWLSGARSELIFQRDNVIFWITGSQSAGMDENGLLNFARQLTPMSNLLLNPRQLQLRQVGYSLVIPLEQEPAAMELIQVAPSGASVTSGAGVIVASPYSADGA